ncbi:MAG: anion permease [Gemmatimonadaceae bacterium]|nr:anion permease [Gemmatimonadaceae bacterium]
MSTSRRWAIVLVVGLAVLAIPTPSGVTTQGWALFALFIATIVGSIARPLPAGAVVFLGVALAAVTGLLSPRDALSGYADPIVWLVLAACFLATALLKTGLGRRIAFHFIRRIGHSSLGLAYALAGTDVVLAGFVPSNSARAGGIIFPIAQSLAHAYESRPGPTARRLGAFLLLTLYQTDVIACATFLTGQASNVLIARFAHDTAHVDISYARWLIGAIPPALIALAVVPWLLFRWFPPEVRDTPQARAIADDALAAMGPLQRAEQLTLVVFGSVALLWITTAWHQLNPATIALGGVAALLVTGVLRWEELTGAQSAWDIFLWYGGVLRLAEAVAASGVMPRFAASVASVTTAWPWALALALLVVVYCYAHYGFASITAHATAMYIPFLAVLLTLGAPPLLSALLLAYTSNLGAALTHYGTTIGPIYFGADYISQRDWWRMGLRVSMVTVALWGTVGVLWWRILGWW